MAKYLKKDIIITSDIYLDRQTIEKILKRNGYEGYNELFLSSEIKNTKSTGDLYKFINYKLNVSKKKILHIGDNFESDVNKAKENGWDACYYPKCTDIFLNYSWKENNVNYCGRLYENFEMRNIDLSNYTEFSGVRTSMSIVANKYFDNPFESFNNNSDFNEDPYLIGYYTLGMHMLAVSKWLLDETTRDNKEVISFMARDGYIPYLASTKLIKTYDNKIDINYMHISRKSIFPLTINEFKDLLKIKEYFKLEKISVETILNILNNIISLPDNYEEILMNKNLFLTKTLKNEHDFENFIRIIWNDFYDVNKYKKYKNTCITYFKNHLNGNSSTFDIGYSGQPELILSDLLNKKIDTYFIHINNDKAFYNSHNANYRLKTFYQFKPTFTGTLREYLMSSNENSCTGYVKNGNNISAVYDNKSNYNYFDKKMLSEIQNGCLDFVDDIVKKFGDKIHLLDFDNYYMSIPFEYYMNFSKDIDRDIFANLTFEENADENINMLEYWKRRINEYNDYFNRYNENNNNIYKSITYTYNNFMDERVNNRNIFVKALFYLIYDRPALRVKIGRKLKYKGFIYSTLKCLRNKK